MSASFTPFVTSVDGVLGHKENRVMKLLATKIALNHYRMEKYLRLGISVHDTNINQCLSLGSPHSSHTEVSYQGRETSHTEVSYQSSETSHTEVSYQGREGRPLTLRSATKAVRPLTLRSATKAGRGDLSH